MCGVIGEGIITVRSNDERWEVVWDGRMRWGGVD